MGWVWNVLLSCSNEEFWEEGEEEARKTCKPLERINQWIPHGKLVSLIGPTYAEGVGYGIDANLFGGGYKHFDIEGFIDVVKAQDWKMRSKVQLWVKGAEEGMGEDPFTLIKLGRRPSSRPKPEAKLTSRSTPKVRTKGKGRRG
jgi:hypothetical protein